MALAVAAVFQPRIYILDYIWMHHDSGARSLIRARAPMLFLRSNCTRVQGEGEFIISNYSRTAGERGMTARNCIPHISPGTGADRRRHSGNHSFATLT